jgi:predicted DNA-binding protein (MmcQ/YjbR family)
MAASKIDQAERALRDTALSFPETTEEFPWGERAIKVRGKVFLFMYVAEGKLHLSLKLPESADAALLLPFCAPTGYGLGKSGWVTSKFEKKDAPPIDVLLEWLEESYRAVAPKKVAAQLGTRAADTERATRKIKSPVKKKAAAKKPAARPTKKKKRRSRT